SGRVRRLVRVRTSGARPRRARRLGPHQLLVQRAVRPARGGGRAALGLGDLPRARLAAARGAFARGREAHVGFVPRAARAAELGLAADERDREGGGAEDRAPDRSGAGAAGGRPAGRRRDEDGGGPAAGPSAEAFDDVVGERRVDDGSREAGVGDRGTGGNGGRERSAAPARRDFASASDAELATKPPARRRAP